ncbi:hypothetical protein C8R46DRAFT_1357181 [Mycena filopes]|nr:hypothetical protein C8R46DRAFT_1357181 [Mycena filopes]
MNSDDDADLACAIAESLRDVPRASTTTKTGPKRPTTKGKKPVEREVLVISSDEEDGVEEVARPVKARVRPSTSKPTTTTPATAMDVDVDPPANANPAPSFLSERAQMERERLARQKRVRGPSPPAPPTARGSSDDEYDEDEDEEEGSEGSARKKARLGDAGVGAGAGNAKGKGTASGSSSASAGGPRRFPQGAILRVDTQHARTHEAGFSTTANANANASGSKTKNAAPDCIRLSTLLGPPARIAFAILSAFVLDAPWLYGFFDRETPVVVVGHGEGEAGAGEGDRCVLSTYFVLLRPPSLPSSLHISSSPHPPHVCVIAKTMMDDDGLHTPHPLSRADTSQSPQHLSPPSSFRISACTHSLPILFHIHILHPLFLLRASASPSLKNIFPSWVRVCPPLYAGRGCMHVKLMVLFYKDEGEVSHIFILLLSLAGCREDDAAVEERTPVYGRGDEDDAVDAGDGTLTPTSFLLLSFTLLRCTPLLPSSSSLASSSSPRSTLANSPLLPFFAPQDSKRGWARVVIGSANLVAGDWRDVENRVWTLLREAREQEPLPTSLSDTVVVAVCLVRRLERLEDGDDAGLLCARHEERPGGGGFVVVAARKAPCGLGDRVAQETTSCAYVFVQDIPPVSPHARTPTTRMRAKEKPGENFPAMLARTLRALGVEEALEIMGKQGHDTLPLPTLLPPSPKGKSPLETNWNWTQVRAALVPSIAGRSMGWAGEKAVVWNAQPRLLRAVLVLGCALDEGVAIGASDRNPEAKPFSTKSTATSKSASKGRNAPEKWELELDCLTSSIGTYTAPWLQAFRLCAAGRPEGLQAWLDRGRKKTPQQGPTHVLFPTLETVRGTALGEGGAGTVFCRRGQWEKIRTLDDRAGLEMRDAKSRSGPVGMHTKMILATLRGPPRVDTDPEATDSDTDPEATDPDTSDVEVVEVKPKRSEADEEERHKPHGWIYIGSHNFTPSAWGSLTGSGFSPVLTVTNYELGVILRLETPEDEAAAVAWEHPARAYGAKDQPWIQDESPFFMP